jgi:hypothetical protein
MKIVIKIFLIISGFSISNFLYALELYNLELVAELPGCGSAIVSGDINGDGFSDVCIGGGKVGSKMCVLIYYGSQTPDTIPDIVLLEDSMDPGNSFGTNIEVGDINGDEFDDVIVMGGASTRIYFGGNPMDTIPDLIAEYGSSGNAS